MLNPIKQQNSVTRYMVTVNKIVDTPNKYQNTIRQSPCTHKHSWYTVFWKCLPDHFKRIPHQIPDGDKFSNRAKNLHFLLMISKLLLKF